jgi:K+-sensing histidine kinase KdpD
VWDTGIGIPTDHHEAIFADFLQLSNRNVIVAKVSDWALPSRAGSQT